MSIFHVTKNGRAGLHKNVIESLYTCKSMHVLRRQGHGALTLRSSRSGMVGWLVGSIKTSCVRWSCRMHAIGVPSLPRRRRPRRAEHSSPAASGGAHAAPTITSRLVSTATRVRLLTYYPCTTPAHLVPACLPS